MNKQKNINDIIIKYFTSKNYKYVKYLLSHSIDISMKRTSPPKELEKDIHVKNIAHDYNIPYGFTYEELENLTDVLIDTNNEDLAKPILDDIISINKQLTELKNISYNINFKHPICGIIGGICSCMNINDIIDYIENATNIDTFPTKENDSYKIKRKNDAVLYTKIYNDVYHVLKKHDSYIGWFPSIHTMEIILKQI